MEQKWDDMTDLCKADKPRLVYSQSADLQSQVMALLRSRELAGQVAHRLMQPAVSELSDPARMCTLSSRTLSSKKAVADLVRLSIDGSRRSVARPPN